MELVPSNDGRTHAKIRLPNGTYREYDVDNVTDPEVLDALNAEIDARHGPGAAAAIEAAFADGSIFGD